MSFKRAGDDHCALRLQKVSKVQMLQTIICYKLKFDIKMMFFVTKQKQRVAELFAEDIPADEVNHTRSGKCVCLVIAAVYQLLTIINVF